MRAASINLSSRSLNRLLLWSAIVVTVYTVLGFFVVPLILKDVIPPRLTKLLQRQVVIERMRFNPYTLGISARGVRISDRSGKGLFASADEFYLNVRMTSLFRRAFVFGHVRVEKPYLALVRSTEGSYNFEDFFEERGTAVRLSFNNIRITNGSVDFRDDMRGVVHTVRDMMVNIPFISNIPYYADVYIHPLFSAAIDGALYEIKGKAKPFIRSLETEIRLIAENVALPDYASYLPPSVGIRVAGGTLNLDLTIRYSQYAARAPSLVVEGDVGLEKLVLHGRGDEPLVELPRLTATLLPTDVLARDICVDRLALIAPVVNLTRDAAGRLNLFSILPWTFAASTMDPTSESDKDGGMRLAVEQATVSNGKIIITDEHVTRPFNMVVDTLNLRLDRLDSRKSQGAPFSLSAHTDAEEQIRAEGSLSLLPLSAKGQVSVRSLAIDRYSPYYESRMPFLVEGGRANLSFQCSVGRSGKERTLRLSAVDAAISNIALKEPGATTPFLMVPIFSISNGGVEMSNRRLTIEAMTTDKGVLSLSRSRSGRINVLRMATSVRQQSGKSRSTEHKQGPGWIVDVKRARVRGYAVSLKDGSTAGRAAPTKIEDIELAVDGFSTERGVTAQIGFSSKVGTEGRLSARGSASLDPVFASLQTTMKNVEIAPFQVYMPTNINLSIERGAVSSDGTLSLRAAETGGPALTYSGALSATDFASTDTTTGNSFLAWKTLSIGSLSAGYNPLFLKADELMLTGYYLRVILGQDGIFNIQHVVSGRREAPRVSRPSPASSRARSSKQGSPALAVGPVNLKSGIVDFTDHYIRPSYSARLTRMDGTISSISAGSNEPASIEIAGQVHDHAPLKVTGRVNPLGSSAYLDFRISVDNLDLTSMSPHSARYVGYTVRRGALTLDATYLLANKELRASNEIGLDQFQFGGGVEGAPVIQMPVKLALSVQTDQEGSIPLDIPVTGDLSNPRFGFTGASSVR